MSRTVAPVISLLTDYGLEDGFVAACHGVIAGIAPDARIIDVSHLVPAGDIRRGAALLAQTVPYLPAGVHVAVVDPGVGTARRAIVLEAGDRLFVGPDNGVLSWAAQACGGVSRAYEICNDDLFRKPVSTTFHGRDIFAPVAAHLSTGVPPAETGPEVPVDRLVLLPPPMVLRRGSELEGEVLCVDRFGNVQLSISEADLTALGVRPGDALGVSLGRWRLTVPLRTTFGSVPPGELVAFVDSAGLLAFAVNSGDAAQRLGLPAGARVRLWRV